MRGYSSGIKNANADYGMLASLIRNGSLLICLEREAKNTQETSQKLASFNVVFWCTDNFKAYNLLPKSQYFVGKTFMQRIEWENLTLRNRLKRLNRKILGYSKSPEIMDGCSHSAVGINVPKWQS
ncbi:IS1 family transposase [Xenorhabdus beddingii]